MMADVNRGLKILLKCYLICMVFSYIVNSTCNKSREFSYCI